jgi:hypothetical protein
VGQPTWRQIAPASGTLGVPSAQGKRWTLALDYLPPQKLIRIVADDSVTIELAQGARSGPDGDPALTFDSGGSTLPVAHAPRGALIGRIGGSTADMSQPKASEAATIPSAAMIFFAAGRDCIFRIPAGVEGGLFLSVNETAERIGHVAGAFTVTIYEAV